MNRLIIWLASFIIVITVTCSAAPDEQGPVYDLAKLLRNSLRRLRNSEQAKELNPLDHLQIGSVNEDFVFQSANTFGNSSKCVADIMYAVQNLKNQWALKMFDSYGKPESGILQGNFRWVGDYTECLNVRATNPNSTSVGNFRGQYCLLSWSLDFLNMTLPTFLSGICIPDSCSTSQLQEEALLQLLQIAGVQTIFPNVSMIVSNSSALTCKPRERHLNAGAKVTIAILSLFGALATLGSSITAARYIKKLVDGFKVSAEDRALVPDDGTAASQRGWLNQLEKFLACFCVFTNGSKLLNTDSSDGEQLLCIHGIRFLSMTWVILGHIYAFGNGIFIRNLLEIPPLIDNFASQVIFQTPYAVDTFFVLSGFLLAYLTMKEFSKRKSISWTYFYVHRYLRLTPMYMVLLAFSATVYFYVGAGPYWPDGDYDVGCSKVWWRNLLYINNFDSEGKQCMGWTWYLANDMQFFVISPLFLITLWRWPRVGYCLLAVFMCASCLCNFVITYHYDLVAGIAALLQGETLDYKVFMEKSSEYLDKIYTKPYTRIGSYLVGLLTGYILFKRKTSQKQDKHSLLFLCTGWIIATTVTLTCVYGLYHTSPTRLAASFYNTFNRICFAMGLCWVIYVCLIGQGGVVDRILSFKLFIPLSRLTYAVYLTHPMIMTVYFSSLKTSLEFSHPTMVVLFLGFVLATYALALPVALILESPLVSLEKLVRKHFVQAKNERPEVSTDLHIK